MNGEKRAAWVYQEGITTLGPGWFAIRHSDTPAPVFAALTEARASLLVELCNAIETLGASTILVSEKGPVPLAVAAQPEPTPTDQELPA